MGEVAKFKPKKPFKVSSDLLVEIIRITPTHAAKWLQQNTLNRPLRRRHVQSLAEQMRAGRWMVNGESIKISEDEDVLDGQHRLHGCVESGRPFESFVVYGLKREAFVTVDTGIVRSGGDVLALHFPEAPRQLCSMVALACGWLNRINNGLTSAVAHRRLSNFQILDQANSQPELWRCGDVLRGYPKDQRLLSLSAGTALFYLFQKKSWDTADEYIRDLYTGESLNREQPAYIVRGIFLRDRNKLAKMQLKDKVIIAIKGWNLVRRNKRKATTRELLPKPDDNTPDIF